MTYVDHAPSRQITGVLAVVAIHAALILALTSGLASRIPGELEKVTKVVFVDPATPTEEPPPVVRPGELTPVVPEVPMPEQVIEVETPPLIALPPVEVLSPPSSGKAISEPSPLKVDPRNALARPEYPPTSIRLNEQGKVLLLIYVLPDGSVGDVKVSRSSGYPRLDASAMREAKRSWRFLAAKSGSGQATAAWGTFEVSFELND